MSLQQKVLSLRGEDIHADLIVTEQGSELVVQTRDVPGSERRVAIASVRKIEIGLEDGEDRLEVTGMTRPLSFAIESSTGTKQVILRDALLAGLDVGASPAAMEIDFDCSQVAGVVTLASGQGDLRVGAVESLFDRMVSIDDEGGLADLSWRNSFLTAGIHADLEGDGSRHITLQDVWSGPANVRVESGQVETLLLGETRVRGFWKSTSQGADDRFVMRDHAGIVGTASREVRDGDAATLLMDSAYVTGKLTARTTGGHDVTRIADQAEVGSFAGSDYRVLRNVVYAVRGARSLKGDLYVPLTMGQHPAMVTIHGGSWRAGTRAAQAAEAGALAARGYVVLNIDYRLAPADPFPAAVHDAKSAVYWLRRHATEHDVDPTRIGAYGYSAGGHLALMLGVTDASSGLEGPDGSSLGLGSQVQAVAAGAPPTDFRDLPANSEEYSYFLGGTRTQFPDVYAQASPAAWVSDQDPPTFMYVGSRDARVSPTKVTRMHELLTAAGVPSELLVLPGQTHLSAINDPAAFLKAVRFLDTQLKSG